MPVPVQIELSPQLQIHIDPPVVHHVKRAPVVLIVIRLRDRRAPVHNHLVDPVVRSQRRASDVIALRLLVRLELQRDSGKIRRFEQHPDLLQIVRQHRRLHVVAVDIPVPGLDLAVHLRLDLVVRRVKTQIVPDVILLVRRRRVQLLDLLPERRLPLFQLAVHLREVRLLFLKNLLIHTNPNQLFHI